MHLKLARDLPSALRDFDSLTRDLDAKRPALFLDYDGTLTPIVSQPKDAVLSEEMREIVRLLASLCTVAVISGRDRADVAGLVGLREVVYAGSHGYDIMAPGGRHVENEAGKECLPDLAEAEAELRAQAERVAGANVERKRFAVAVHYRNVAADDVPRVMETVEAISRKYLKLKKSAGKKVIELRPAHEWDKGRAVLWLLGEIRTDEASRAPIYIGDDLTDEDAFRALAGLGIGILVGEHGERTSARFHLHDVGEVEAFLQRLAGWLQR